MMNAVLPVGVGILIGYLTNWVAIKLLFWPRWRLGPLQGAIPKNKSRIAADVADLTVEHLLAPEKIAEMVRAKIGPKVPAAFRSTVNESIGPLIGSLMPRAMLKETIIKTVEEMDDRELEARIRQVAASELIMIKWSGAVLGAVIGLVQVWLV